MSHGTARPVATDMLVSIAVGDLLAGVHEAVTTT